ncbi:MAG: glycosyltransferase family 2 protein [Actinobacteria bacterium]|nr:glycosyltransferase family 2 protein [Actinomycetota bacterium]
MSGRIVAVVPAFNEERSIGAVIREIRAFDPAMVVVVVDDHSSDGTAEAAEAEGAVVIRLPYNLGIGGAVQTGFKYAVREGFDTAVRLDGDGQHVAAELRRLLEPIARGEADIVTGSRFVGPAGSYRPPLARRLGIHWFANLVSVLTWRRVTDTTSGFQALNRRAIALFAVDYPTDYPEVEGTLLVLRSGLRLREVQVEMREREHGVSSITLVRSVYYVLKVTLALVVASLRSYKADREAVEAAGA